MNISASSLDGVEALMFDFYGTVVDMQRGLVEAIAPYLADKGYTTNPPSRVVTWWRRTHFENSMIDALLHRTHTPYREIGHEALSYTLDRAGIDHTTDEVARLVSKIEHLEPFPDVVEALGVIKDHGLRLVILSNGDPDMLSTGVSNSGTEALWDQVLSVAAAGTFKPHAAAYATAADQLALEPYQILFVANHSFDCVGAKAAGMKTAFVDRRKRPFGNPRYTPDVTVDDCAALAATVASHSKVAPNRL